VEAADPDPVANATPEAEPVEDPAVEDAAVEDAAVEDDDARILCKWPAGNHAVGKGLQEVLMPLQTDFKAVMAASTLLPHSFLICASTFEASEPHTTGGFAGSLSVLRSCQKQDQWKHPWFRIQDTYLTAARRHAGGVATANWAETARRARKRVDLTANMLEDLRLILFGLTVLGDREVKEEKYWKTKSASK